MPCPNYKPCRSCLNGSFIPSPDGLPPPSSNLTTTYFPPTHSEVVHSRAVIRSAEETVPRIQAMIDDLEKRKVELLCLTRTHRAVVSPLRSFPPEILVNIFAAFVSMADEYRTPGWICSPFALMWICSRWRRIVLDTPRLWTKILGDPPMIDSWIIQSKQLPLDLRLELGWPSSYSIRVLEALIPHAHRWERVDLSLGQNSPTLARTRTHLHSLKRLNLCFMSNTTPTVDFCEVAPQLTDVSLTGICGPVNIRLPWEQLKTCALDNAGFALHVLQHATNLRMCRLDMPSFAADHTWLPTPRSHHCHTGLDTLIIRWSFEDPNINSFVSSITLPSLRTLEIDFDSACSSLSHDDSDDDNDTDDEPEMAPVAMSGFLERSSTHLSTLTLTDISFSSAGLIKCLALVPSLVSLDICFKSDFKFALKYMLKFNSSSRTISDELLLALNANLPGYILPCLRSLSLRGRITFSDETLDAFVASRRQINPANDGVALFENLTLECYAGPRRRSTKQLPQFHRFVSGGLNITYGGSWNVCNSIQADNSESLGAQA